ncbi:hypothetical protein ACFFX0_14575 [Citricoccus parietis]|uniref:Uncharacterized protein n=1 Tax=Citricoccus parietis TaxID=592307 RepID=A0ABV5G0C8_9MICC
MPSRSSRCRNGCSPSTPRRGRRSGRLHCWCPIRVRPKTPGRRWRARCLLRPAPKQRRAPRVVRMRVQRGRAVPGINPCCVPPSWNLCACGPPLR